MSALKFLLQVQLHFSVPKRSPVLFVLESPLFGGTAVCKLRFGSKKFYDHFRDVDLKMSEARRQKSYYSPKLVENQVKQLPSPKNCYRAVLSRIRNA